MRLRTFATVVTIATLFAATSSLAQEVSDPDYVKGHNFWKAGRFSSASGSLSRFRAKPFGERFEVDYWLGTSWCRIEGEEPAGWDMLDWAMYSYPLSPDTLNIFKAERDLCRALAASASANREQPRVVSVRPTGTGATARAEQTKIFFIPGGGDGALRAYPPRTKREIPVETFEARLVPSTEPVRAVELVGKLVSGFRVVRSGQFILASRSPAHTVEALERIGRTLETFATFLRAEFGIGPPSSFITVYMVPNPGELHTLADRLHGLDVSPGTLGYAFQNDASVLAVVEGSGVGTLLHEVFHLAVRSSYGAIPQWLDEGMASLYETCTVIGEQFLGEPNWRAIVINELGPTFVTLQEVIVSPWFFDEPGGPADRRRDPAYQAYVMAMARNFVLYLQEQGKLNAVFSAYHGRKPGGTFVPAPLQAVQLVEDAVGVPLSTIETQFRAWYPQVKNPQTRIHVGKPVEKEIPKELFEQIDRATSK